MTSLNFKNENMDSITILLKLATFLPYKVTKYFNHHLSYTFGIRVLRNPKKST